MSDIRRTREVVAYENDYVTVYDDEVAWPSGRRGRHVRVSPKVEGLSVVILAQKQHELGMVKSFRYPIGAPQWGFPRGFSHGPDLFETVAAELQEELGATAVSMRVIGYLTPDSGLLSSRVAVVHAQVLEADVPSDQDEVYDTTWLGVDALKARIRSGDIEDGFTLAALMLHEVRHD